MGELHEIVSVEETGRLFLLLAFGLPLLGMLAGVGWGAYHKQTRRYGVMGLLAGMIGPLNWVMWNVFNILTNRNGLDTVRNVFVNLAVFVIIGLCIGLGLGSVLRRAESSSIVEPGEVSDSTEKCSTEKCSTGK